MTGLLYLGSPAALTRADGQIVFFRLKQKTPINLERLSTEELMRTVGFTALLPPIPDKGM